MTDHPHNQPDDRDNGHDVAPGAGEGVGYEPSYSEPNYGTTHPDGEWQLPETSEPVSDDDTTHASPPDSTPLTGQDSSVAPESAPAPEPAVAAWWETGQNSPAGGGGATSYGEQPPYSQGPPPGGQGGQWNPQGQQYQGGPPMGGMPPQPYTGGYAPMSTGPNNPNWLAGPSEQGRSTLQLDYWLSVFFSWIPALIFFLTEKDKNRLMDEHTKELLNFNITRIIVGAVAAVPIIGWIVGGIGSIVLFVMAILGAMKGPDDYANGRTYQFPLTFRFIK